jgi:ribosome-associated translation inhibitor RaiA
MGVVRYVGIKALTNTEQEVTKTLVMRHAEKLDRFFTNYACTFHTKLYDIEGRAKYAFRAKVSCPGVVLSSDATDWDLRRTVHKVMQKILQEAEHTFHKQGQKQQQFHPRKAKRGTGKHVKLKLRRRVRML